jgi:hypothetical protein
LILQGVNNYPNRNITKLGLVIGSSALLKLLDDQSDDRDMLCSKPFFLLHQSVHQLLLIPVLQLELIIDLSSRGCLCSFVEADSHH